MYKKHTPLEWYEYRIDKRESKNYTVKVIEEVYATMEGYDKHMWLEFYIVESVYHPRMITFHHCIKNFNRSKFKGFEKTKTVKLSYPALVRVLRYIGFKGEI